MKDKRPDWVVGGRYIGRKSVCCNAGVWARPAGIREEGQKAVFKVYIPICSECHRSCKTYETDPRPIVKQSGSSMLNKLFAALKKLWGKVKK